MNQLEYPTNPTNLTNPNQINFNNYPKSDNHEITWTKKDNINMCDLNKNCSKIVFKIKKKNNIDNNIDALEDNQSDTKTIYEKTLFDKLPKGVNNINETFDTNTFFIINYEHVLYFFIILFIIIVIIRCKKN